MRNSSTEKHFNKIAKDYDYYKKKNSFYYGNLKELLKDFVPENNTVLEVGCGTGDLLIHLRPSKGYGFDISRKMIEIANSKYIVSKNTIFSTSFPKGKFDYVLMSDVIEHLENPNKTFGQISKVMNKNSKLIITMANPIWEPLLIIAERLKLKMPEGPHKRITNDRLKIIIEKEGMKIIKHDYKLLVPVKIPFVTYFANKYLERFLKSLAFLEYFIVVRV